MIIPVRVPADMKPVLANELRFTVHESTALAELGCPVCDLPLPGQPSVLVFAGIEPESRKPGGWATEAAVVVHAACAGVPAEEPGREPEEQGR